MSEWGTFTDGETVYDLSHLDAFHMSVSLKADGSPKMNVLVTFWHHTFAKELAEDTPAHMIVSRDGDDRCFCPIRYGWSLNLPSLIRKGAGGKAHWGKKKEGRADNYLFVDHLPGLKGPYVIYFNMARSKIKGIDATMFVTSAHEKPNLARNLSTINFAALVKIISAGGVPKQPQKRW